MFKTVALLFSALVLCARPAAARRRSRKCRYRNYPPTRPGDELRGPTHTCTCHGSGRWVNCYRNSEDVQSSSSSVDNPGTIVDVAISAGFSTLVAAVQAADLVTALSSDGPFTVFAPTDEAFAALPEGVLDSLLDDTAALTSVLLYHVIGGSRVEADDIPNFLRAETLEGDQVALRSNSKGVSVNRKAKVISADVDASNGIIHVIDRVLIPNSVDLDELVDFNDLTANGVFPICDS